MLRRGRRVAPRRTGGSSPASKTGSAPKTGRRPAATCAPGHRADPGWRNRRVIGSGTAQALCEVESAGEHRTPLQQRLFRVVEQVVGPRHRVAQRVVAFQAAPRADQQPEPLIETITHLARRSSTPSARPPTRWPTGSRRGGGRSPPPRPPRRAGPARSRGATLWARSTNRFTAAESIPAPTSSEGTGHNCSSATPSPSRLVARIVTVAECAEDGLDQIGGGVDARARSCRTPATGPCPPARRPPTRSRSCPVVG